MISVGSTLPEVTFGLLKDGKTTNPHTNDIFGGKKVVVFAVPGAFTPTCSAAHLPGYVALADKIKAKGVDDIVCISVNDAFVMDAWKQASNADEITMLADGNAYFTKTIGMDMNTGDFGGARSVRYSMLVEDGEVTQLFVEDPGRFEVSDAESMLKVL
ncbi:peroxiredoxin [Alteromonas confluentis]|uniref:Glutathione-dependent peroxiredoxin n=1 Tax=Alteromonas confluentis TaxID=1656094 RepID=A0A1E7Z9P0_9ALTE|nr:peroxiredoxin [Alteromonas confluentis]OFC70240.1 peroxiredoxin [Alteromonas confluentis]